MALKNLVIFASRSHHNHDNSPFADFSKDMDRMMTRLPAPAFPLSIILLSTEVRKNHQSDQHQHDMARGHQNDALRNAMPAMKAGNWAASTY